MSVNIKDVIAKAWEAAWDRGEIEPFGRLLHPDYRRITGGNGIPRDAEYVMQEIRDLRTALPDLVTEIDSLVVDESGESAAVFWHSTGTFTNDMPGAPASGARLQTRGANLLTIRDGLVLEERVTWDRKKVLADLGVPTLSEAFEPPKPIIVDGLSGVPSIDALKSFNRQFITGVTIVTTLDADGTPRGLAANSYASVSLDPPLVLVCVQKSTLTHDPLFTSSYLGINIASTAQRDLVGVFASKTLDKFAGVDWRHGPHGSPLIEGSAASIEAEIKERFVTKTHTIFISKVTFAEAANIDALIYKGGAFFDSADLCEL